MTRIVVPLRTLALTAATLFVVCSGCGSDRGLGYDVPSNNNKMHQIALAIGCYEQTHGSFPSAVMEKDGKPLLSWRVAILPLIDEDALYKRFHLDEPWDSPHNLEVAKGALINNLNNLLSWRQGVVPVAVEFMTFQPES
jgi:hypothetical protein